jgi:two-component system chemotaxis response regulator CheY
MIVVFASLSTHAHSESSRAALAGQCEENDMLTLKALVIDDSRVMRNMVMNALRQSRLATFEFTEACDGADALTKFDPNTIDICFVDWNMPNMTGVEFIRQARARGNAFKVPMVMVTSEQTMAKIEEALSQAGADAFICKPFTPDDMRVKLEKTIHKVTVAKTEPAEQEGFFSRLFS